MTVSAHISFLCIVWYGLLALAVGKSSTLNISPIYVEPIALKGVVLDEETKQPVGYANILLVQGKKATQTDSKGEFILHISSATEKESIKVTSLGYASRTIEVTSLLKSKSPTATIAIYLKPKYQDLKEVQVKAKSKHWRERKVGYNIDKGTDFHHHFSPLDTVIHKSGQEIGNRFELKKYPAYLQSISFGLAGSGNVKAIVWLRLYSLQNNKPDQNLLPQDVIIRTDPHHTGWITVDVKKYNITLKDDFAVAVEWLSDTNKLSKNSLMAFATHPKGQVTYTRNSDKENWKVVKPTFTSINSIGLYVTVAY